MEVFSVFATLSLVDMLSGPLDRAMNAVRGMESGVASLGQRMGSLALSMAPVALAAGAMLGAFGMAARKAMTFESAMADVAKVVNFESQAEFQAMNKTVMDMAGRIPMAADGIAAIIAAAGQSGVAKQDLAEFAEQAAKMGVAFDLTGDQAGKMMADWRAGMNLTLPQTYALADAVNHLSNNMNATAPALGEVIQRVGAVAMVCGLSETKVAALGAAFLSAGAAPEVAATALKSFTTTLVKGTAMSKSQAKAFASVGLSATQLAKDMQTDAQGTIFKVLEAIAAKPKELQMSLLTEMFGQESLGAIAPLLKNMGNLSQAFELVGDASNYAGSMQKEFDARSKTVANALQLLSNRLTNLAIAVGNAFLPSIGWAAEKLGAFADMLRTAAETKAGQWLLQLAGAMGTALLALTALSASMWFFSALPAMLGKALLPLKTALLGLGAPVYAAIAVLGLLYAAYRTNFGGMADYLHECWNKISLTVRGVLAVFQTLKDGSGEIRGELATQIKAAGLAGLVTTVSRIVYRIQAVFRGFRTAVSAAFTRMDSAFVPVRLAVAELMQSLRGLFGAFSGNEVTSAASAWEAFGAALGDLAGGVLEGLTTALVWLVDGLRLFASVIGYALNWISALCSGLFTLTGATAAANDSADPASWTALGKMLGVVLASVVAARAALLLWRGAVLAVSVVTKAWTAAQWLLNAAMRANPIGLVIAAVMALAAAAGWVIANWEEIASWWNALWSGMAAWTDEKWNAVVSVVNGACANVQALVSGLWTAIIGGLTTFGASLLAGITTAWAAVLEFFGGLSLFESGARLLSTFIDGIKSMASSVVDSVAGVLASVREYLPFSDAHVGPLSQLTLSGARMMTTLAEGVASAQGGLVSRVSGALAGVGGAIRDWWNGALSGGGAPTVAAPELPQPATPEIAIPQAPSFGAPDEGRAESWRRGDGQGGQNISIYGNIVLPEVQKAEDFGEAMRSYLQGELSMMEGMA